MKKLLFIAVTCVMFSACSKKEEVAPGAQVKAAWSSSDKFASWSNGGYTIYNNVWGSGAGWQSIWANSGTNWGVSCNHSGGGIKSYPNNEKWLNKTTGSTSYCGTYFNVSRPSTGAYSSTFDVWANNKRYEVMMWMTKSGSIGAIGSLQASNQSIGGHTWNVYRGWNGSIEVFSFIRTSSLNSGNVDHKAIWNWLQSRGWWNNPTVNNLQFGFEITNTGGTNQSFTCNSRSDWNG
jgi:hypothetical protein